MSDHNRQLPSPCRYHILVGAILNERWSEWFEGFSIIPQPDGCTLLQGDVADQAELFGVLLKIRDLNLELVSVQQI